MNRETPRETPALGTRWSIQALGTRWSAAMLGTRWNFASRRILAGAVATLVTIAIAASPGFHEMREASGRMASVIVRELPGSGDAPERAVEAIGGSVERHIGIIDSFVADVPSGGLRDLASTPGVHSVTPNRPVKMLHAQGGIHTVGESDSFHGTASVIGATDLYGQGITGAGVDVAMIDTGALPVNGLSAPDKLVHGPDLSFDSQVPELRYLDTYGHGTHMAGIIAARDDAAQSVHSSDHENYLGIAPGARVVSVKVGNAMGVTDVSQVLAAIDWVVQHRNADGLNIRVLNLSFGTDGTQDYLVDPLTYAAEVAWRKGIVVVAAAGNEGYGNAKLNNPAYDPHIIAVGADDTHGSNKTNDDLIPDFSARGNNVRNPDLVAPGRSVVSLRAPGSFIDEMFPGGRVGERFFRGTGTSQSAAVVSGAVALLLQQRPDLTPDQVKYMLRTTTKQLPAADAAAQGRGLLNVKAAADASTPPPVLAAQPFPYGDGSGSLHLSRGTAIIEDELGNQLSGEQTIFGDPFDGRTWAGMSFDGRTWAGGDWMGRTWAGRTWAADSFDGRTWAGRTWASVVWDGRTWAGRTWAADNFTGRTWAGRTWAGSAFDGRTWAGRTWAGRTWADDSWSGRTWAGRTWAGASWD